MYEQKTMMREWSSNSTPTGTIPGLLSLADPLSSEIIVSITNYY